EQREVGVLSAVGSSCLRARARRMRATRDDAIDELDAACGTDAARRALAAGFDGAEFERITGHARHVDAIVEYHHAAVAEQRVSCRQRLVFERRVELGCRQ